MCPTSPEGSRKQQASSEIYRTFSITQRVSATSYDSDLPAHTNIHPVVKIEYLKPYHPSHERFEPRGLVQMELPEDLNSAIWEVEERRCHRENRGGKEFLCHRKSSPNHGDTWEKQENVKYFGPPYWVQQHHRSAEAYQVSTLARLTTDGSRPCTSTASTLRTTTAAPRLSHGRKYPRPWKPRSLGYPKLLGTYLTASSATLRLMKRLRTRLTTRPRCAVHLPTVTITLLGDSTVLQSRAVGPCELL